MAKRRISVKTVPVKMSEDQGTGRQESDIEMLEKQIQEQRIKEEERIRKEEVQRRIEDEKQAKRDKERERRQELKYQISGYKVVTRPLNAKEAIGQDIKTSGGQFFGESVGIVGGLIGVEYLRTKLENKVVTQSSTLPGLQRWVINNGPKLAAYYMLRRYTRYMNDSLMSGMMSGIEKSLPASVILDSYNRITGKRLLQDQQWVPLTEQQIQNIEKILNSK